MDYIDLLFIKLGAADRFFFNAMKLIKSQSGLYN